MFRDDLYEINEELVFHISLGPKKSTVYSRAISLFTDSTELCSLVARHVDTMMSTNFTLVMNLSKTKVRTNINTAITVGDYVTERLDS